MCVDYRALNKITLKDSTVSPLMSDCLTSNFNGKKWFSKIDLRDGFFNVRIVEKDQHKTAFRTKYGSYEYLVVPFGLTNAPATFTRMMNRILGDLVDRYITVYVDDILISSYTFEEHKEHVAEVFRRLDEHTLFVKREKCLLFQQEMEFCGFMLSGTGMRPLVDSKVEVSKISRPKSVKEVQSFLGSLNYFRQFIPEFASISIPLTELTKKNHPWTWTKKQEDAFVILKSKLLEAPLLRHFDNDRQTIVHTDASLYAIGGWIGQEYGDAILHFAYWSRKLNPAETRYPTHERELMAMVKIFEKFHHLLIGCDVVAMTDHRALIRLQTQDTLSHDRAGGSHHCNNTASRSTIYRVKETTWRTSFPASRYTSRYVLDAQNGWNLKRASMAQ